MKNLSDNIKNDLGSIVAQGIKNIFSEMFNVRIISDKEVYESSDTDMVCIGRLVEGHFVIALRLLFNHDILTPLLENLYSAEYLQDETIYEDAACEIVNILSSQVKAYLNKHDYNLSLDFPVMGAKNQSIEDADSVMNIQFCLQDNEDTFRVDVTASEN